MSAEIKAAQARELLDNPLLVDAFADIREGLVQAAERAPANDADTHRTLVISLQLLAQLKQAIAQHVETGEIHQFELAQKKRGFFR